MAVSVPQQTNPAGQSVLSSHEIVLPPTQFTKGFAASHLKVSLSPGPGVKLSLMQQTCVGAVQTWAAPFALPQLMPALFQSVPESFVPPLLLLLDDDDELLLLDPPPEDDDEPPFVPLDPLTDGGVSFEPP